MCIFQQKKSMNHPQQNSNDNRNKFEHWNWGPFLNCLMNKIQAIEINNAKNIKIKIGTITACFIFIYLKSKCNSAV